jgi:hypothetical protein
MALNAGTEPTDRHGSLQYFLAHLVAGVGDPGSSRIIAAAGITDPGYNRLGVRSHDELELSLLRPRYRGCRDGQGMAQGAQDAQATLDPVGADGVRNHEQITARITGFVSFHGANLKQGVGHRLSDAKK